VSRKMFVVTVAGIVLLAGAILAAPALKKFRVVVPEYHKPGQIVSLQQGWTDDQRFRFHHTAQGTRLLPYRWFMALEQPCFSLFACNPFSETTYLGRFGFLESKPDPKLNPDGLPVGFAYQEDFFDPVNKKTYPVVGLTCAACHTGELHYGNYAVRIEGGPAMIEVAEFQKALGLAMAFTQLIPGRYGRFEERVLGPNPTEGARKDLKDSFDRLLGVAKGEQTATGEAKIYVNPAGFARTDALTRIGNQVFAVDMENNRNFAQSNAAVRYPQIWDASWFNWVQYNSSISDPLIRNIGEALGVRAAAKLYGDDAAQFESSVSIENLKAIEELLSGPAPYQGLSSPKWPSVFPKLDAQKVERGAHLYKQNCEGCHRPSVEDLRADLALANPKYWWQNKQGKRFLVVKDVPLDVIGTDAHEAMDFLKRTADSGDLHKGTISAAVGLDLVTKGIANRFFERMSFTPEQRIQYSAFRDPGDVAVRAEAIYKARPLNGIWAVAPYLHNGSVANLYDLLSPQSERPDKFWLGRRQFDPVKVGYDTAELKGGYLYDTSRAGNSNSGHEFKDGPRGKGVIGPALSPDDRWAIIEYLKSL
jgi:mono/diheme cytochrome c family protein